MDIRHAGALALVSILTVAGCDGAEVKVATSTEGPLVVAATDIEAGRYLVKVGGCNDCHTPGYAPRGGNVEETEWLKGNPVGFRGPWGTTYAHNLRLTTANMTEDDWVEMLGTRQDLPIMPWPSVRAMSEADRRAVYRYIRSLPGEAGAAAPTALAPGVEPTTPYENMVTVMPKTG
ncbi:cytochrome C [Brevundimonas sp.]|uniref:cytochrome C n=1 Tax=Brevundimonas sp. TaxID=1871086 RepID=UPI002ABB82FA|nr:cytochrome C [Brevundimonas sp.]MDZ4363157.1 cytochrome C [Brevundimonas sp.]